MNKFCPSSGGVKSLLELRQMVNALKYEQLRLSKESRFYLMHYLLANARGRDGELRIREPDFLGLASEWLRAGEQMGLPALDLNGQHGQGMYKTLSRHVS